MIYQEAPRKTLRGCIIEEKNGFWLDGKNRDDCISQLREWSNEHPEKWIYFYDCGLGPGYPIPVARHLFEVAIYDEAPSRPKFFFTLFKEGLRFQIGDWVYADDWCYGQIVAMDGNVAIVEFETSGGGGSFSFELSELRPASNSN